MKSEQEQMQLEQEMTRDTKELEDEEERIRLCEQEYTRMKSEEELHYAKFGDRDLDPDSDSRYEHIQLEGSLMVSYPVFYSFLVLSAALTTSKSRSSVN